MKSSYLKRQIYSVVKYVTRNSKPLCRAENGKVELLWPIFHVRPAQPVFRFNASGVPEFCFLEYISEFCREIEVRHDVDVYGFVDYFFQAWHRFCEINSWNWQRFFFFFFSLATIDMESLPPDPDLEQFSSVGSNIFCPNRTRSAKSPVLF